LSEDLLIGTASVDREGGVASESGSVVDLSSDGKLSSSSVSEGSGSAIIVEVRSPVSDVVGELGNPVLVSLLVATHVHGESSVGKLVQSEGSHSGHDSSSWDEVLEGPLLVLAVLAVPPGESVAISEGPSVWGKAPGVHLDVSVGSGESLVSSVSPDREGSVSSSSDSIASVGSKSKVALALKSDGRGSGVEDHVGSPVSDA